MTLSVRNNKNNNNNNNTLDVPGKFSEDESTRTSSSVNNNGTVNNKQGYTYYSTWLARKINSNVNSVSDSTVLTFAKLIGEEKKENLDNSGWYFRLPVKAVLAVPVGAYNFIHIPAKASHAVSGLLNLAAAIQEFILTGVALVVSIPKPVITLGYRFKKGNWMTKDTDLVNTTDKKGVKFAKNAIQFYATSWEFSARGHFYNSLSYLGAAIVDLASVILTPQIGFDLNNKYKRNFNIIPKTVEKIKDDEDEDTDLVIKENNDVENSDYDSDKLEKQEQYTKDRPLYFNGKLLKNGEIVVINENDDQHSLYIGEKKTLTIDSTDYNAEITKIEVISDSEMKDLVRVTYKYDNDKTIQQEYSYTLSNKDAYDKKHTVDIEI
jgi:hypothetical protein